MAAVIIGAGPHKGSHTAVAIDGAEAQLGSLRVRASAGQAGRPRARRIIGDIRENGQAGIGSRVALCTAPRLPPPGSSGPAKT